MDKHIIFSDIDGTVYPTDHTIHPQTLKDIKTAQDLGVEFAICTGNASLEGERMLALAETLNARYVVGSNGASLYDMKLKKYIYASVIPKEKAQMLLKYSIDNGISANWWDTKNIFGNKFATDELKSAASNAILLGDRLMDTSDHIDGDILKIEFYDEPDKVDLAEEFANKEGLQAARMKPIHVEVTHEGVSKGHGVEQLCELLGVDIKNTMAIGDSANDVGMFKVAGHSYAMDNAPDNIKAEAMHHTSDVRQNGLGEAIIDYLHRTKLDRN